MSALRANKRALTLSEIIIALVIMGILITLSVVSVMRIKGQEDEKNAKTVLSAIQKAEWDYSIRTEACTADFDLLEINDPNRVSPLYTYSITCSPAFQGKACKKNKPSDCITIDQYGEFGK